MNPVARAENDGRVGDIPFCHDNGQPCFGLVGVGMVQIDEYATGQFGCSFRLRISGIGAEVDVIPPLALRAAQLGGSLAQFFVVSVENIFGSGSYRPFFIT